MWSDLTLDPPFEGQTRMAKLISGYNSFFIKCPLWDACLHSGEAGEREGLLAPAFSIAYSLATTGRILFKFRTCMQ